MDLFMISPYDDVFQPVLAHERKLLKVKEMVKIICIKDHDQIRKQSRSGETKSRDV